MRVAFETDLDAFDDLGDATGWLVVEKFGDFVPDDFVVFWVGFVFGGKEDLFFDFQGVEAFDATVVFSFGLFSFCGGLLQCGGFVVGGGFELFWFFEPLQEQLKLVRIELLAAFSVEQLGEGV